MEYVGERPALYLWRAGDDQGQVEISKEDLAVLRAMGYVDGD